MRKPSWMGMRTWVDFVGSHPDYRCALCGDDEPSMATVDHIRPRWQGGTDDASNLQWACRRCNSRKGPRDDPYWEQLFYFDNTLTLDALRYAQRVEGFDKVLEYADWFSRPFSQISRKLYVPAWVVGTGKTLLIPTLGFALNHLIRREIGVASPRVDRILVLAKEQAIRGQIVKDLREQITGYGLCGIAPRVSCVDAGDMFDDARELDRCDIAVACLQMFFDQKDGRMVRDAREILARFRLIVVDEPHFAVDQVLRIVEAASTSLCFGTTGSPIDADGKQLKSFVLFSTYGYSQANENDHCLKYLPLPKEAGWRDVYEEVDIERAEMYGNGRSYETKSTKAQDYDINIWPVIAVAERVVQYVYECDHGFPLGERDPLFSDPYELAAHREPPTVADLTYPLHAMIRVEDIDTGRTVEKYLNKMFEASRAKYPESLGWRSALVHSSTSDGDGNAQPAKKLPPEHDWLYYKESGVLSARCARFLIVVGMGREGLHNPYCGVVGLACRCLSMVEGVQRVIGRQLRAVMKWIFGVLHVPPATLDTIKIVSHSTFGNRSHVEKAARFVRDMAEHLKGIPTLEALAEDKVEERDIPGLHPESVITGRERLQIAGVIGAQRVAGRDEVDVDSIVDVFGGDDEPRREKVREWVQTVIERPPIARWFLGITPDIREFHRVMREHHARNPSKEVLEQFIKREYPKLIDLIPEIGMGGAVDRFAAETYHSHAKQFHLPDLPVRTNLSTVNRQIAAEIESRLGGNYTGEKNLIHRFVYSAMRIILGVPDGVICKNGGPDDVPECHAILGRPEIREQIRGWVINKVTKEGYCPNLAAGLGIVVEVACDVS